MPYSGDFKEYQIEVRGGEEIKYCSYIRRLGCAVFSQAMSLLYNV